MPIKYALRKKRTTALPREERTKLSRIGYSLPELQWEYEEVPQIVAEYDEKYGVQAYFSHNGMKVSDWILCKKTAGLEAEIHLGRQKPGAPMKDGIGQEFLKGDYTLTHNNSHDNLELMQVVRNMKTKTLLEHFERGWQQSGTVQKRDPDTLIRIPKELVEGGDIIPATWTKRYSIMDRTLHPDGKLVGHIRVSEAEALNSDHEAYFGYFDDHGVLCTGWINLHSSESFRESLAKTVHQKKLHKELEIPLTDFMGTDILPSDLVFSNDNSRNNWMLCEVIAFTENKVRLIAYQKHWKANTGFRQITLNRPKNIIKLPITVTTV